MIVRDGIYFLSIGHITELPVTIGKLRFFIDFSVMRGIGEEELTTPIVLGRIFLAQCQDKIDYRMMWLIVSSRFDSEMHNLQHASLELKHRGVIPLYARRCPRDQGFRDRMFLSRSPKKIARRRQKRTPTGKQRRPKRGKKWILR